MPADLHAVEPLGELLGQPAEVLHRVGAGDLRCVAEERDPARRPDGPQVGLGLCGHGWLLQGERRARVSFGCGGVPVGEHPVSIRCMPTVITYDVWKLNRQAWGREKGRFGLSGTASPARRGGIKIRRFRARFRLEEARGGRLVVVGGRPDRLLVGATRGRTSTIRGGGRGDIPASSQSLRLPVSIATVGSACVSVADGSAGGGGASDPCVPPDRSGIVRGGQVHRAPLIGAAHRRVQPHFCEAAGRG